MPPAAKPFAQPYIDALRSGDFLKAISLAPHTLQDYVDYRTRMGKDGVIGTDEAMGLLVFELLKTNITDRDVDYLYCFYEAAYEIDPFQEHGNTVRYSLNAAMACHLANDALKRDPSTSQRIASQIDRETALRSSKDPNSDFSQLTAAQNEPPEYDKVEYLTSVIMTMPPAVFKQFGTTITALRAQAGGEPTRQVEMLIARREQFERYFNDYKQLLINKLAQAGIFLNKEREIRPGTVTSSKQIQILIDRYNQIQKLDPSTQTPQQIFKEVEACESHRVDWRARNLLQKTMDVFSLGSTALRRNQFSKQTELAQRMKETLQDLREDKEVQRDSSPKPPR